MVPSARHDTSSICTSPERIETNRPRTIFESIDCVRSYSSHSKTFRYTKREHSFSVHPIGCTPAFLFIFIIIRLFRLRYTFYHVNDYGIKLCGVLRSNDWSPGILFDILSNLTGIAAAPTRNLLTFRKPFRLMCF